MWLNYIKTDEIARNVRKKNKLAPTPSPPQKYIRIISSNIGDKKLYYNYVTRLPLI